LEGSRRGLIVVPSLDFHSATEKDLNLVGGFLSSSEARPKFVQP